MMGFYVYYDSCRRRLLIMITTLSSCHIYMFIMIHVEGVCWLWFLCICVSGGDVSVVKDEPHIPEIKASDVLNAYKKMCIDWVWSRWSVCWNDHTDNGCYHPLRARPWEVLIHVYGMLQTASSSAWFSSLNTFS